MDGRGCELQQVESKHRFWWRAAHVVPPLEPEAAQWATRRAREPMAAPRSRGITRSGERRFRRSPRGRRCVVPSLMAALVVAAAFVLPPPISLEKLKIINFLAEAEKLMIAAGFGINQVNVSGQHYTSDSDVFDALDLPNVKTFVAFDSEAALKRIERIPWVDTAQLTRVYYPGALDIVVHERAPAFVWMRGETNYLVDVTGRMLGPMPEASKWNLPRVIGDGADSEAILMLSALRQCPQIEQQYAYGERIGERRWRIVLKNGTVLDLAADREIEGLQEVANAHAVQSALTGKPMIIDVRTPGRIAMRPTASAVARTASVAGFWMTAAASVR